MLESGPRLLEGSLGRHRLLRRHRGLEVFIMVEAIFCVGDSRIHWVKIKNEDKEQTRSQSSWACIRWAFQEFDGSAVHWLLITTRDTSGIGAQRNHGSIQFGMLGFIVRMPDDEERDDELQIQNMMIKGENYGNSNYYASKENDPKLCDLVLPTSTPTHIH